MALGVGGIIGAGIFVLTGHAAAANAGPAVTLSFLLGAIACAFAGLCYAEMSSTVPISGSAYTYAYATLGELVAWIIGWDLILEYAVGAVTVAIGWSGYVVSFARDFGLDLPARLVSAPLSYDAGQHTWSATGAILNVPAVVVIVAITSLLVIGIRESAQFNNFIVAIKLTVIFLFLVFAAHAFSTANWVAPANPDGRFIPPNAGYGVYGWSGVLRGAAVVFFAYIGFDAVSTAAQEAETPNRDMPIGILGSLVICAFLYIAVGFVLTGIVPFDRLNVPDPIAVGIDAAGVGWLAPLIKLGIVLGLTSVILVMLLAQPRIFRAMAHDGLLPKAAAKIHPRFHTPHVATIGSGRGGCRARRAVADRPGRRARQHRDAVRVGGLRRNAGVADCRSRIAASVQGAADLDRGPGGCCDLGLSDVRPAARYLASPRRVARDRARDLFRLWLKTQPDRQLQVDRDGLPDHLNHERVWGSMIVAMAPAGIGKWERG